MSDWKDHLDLPDPPEQTRVVVAMSGGVDSSVTAALLAQAGYDVIGITLQLYQSTGPAQKGSCCAVRDVQDARSVAEAFRFPHYVLDYQSLFNQNVIQDFADSYLRGETPLPCVRCNQQVKFKDLLGAAKNLGAQALVTGHYVRRLKVGGKVQLHQAIDDTKDQSYFLFATTQEQLDFLRFPLGGLQKTRVRQYAADLGLKIAEKPDSQDICFVPNGNYAKVVEKLRPGSLTPGDIVHEDGRILGRHPGIIHYTIGQRKGLGIGGAGEPLYVTRLDPEQHKVIVGPQSALASTQIAIKEINWMGGVEESSPTEEVSVKIRSSQKTPLPATLTWHTTKTGMLTLQAPEYGVAGGQACVFYRGSQVLGGGWIETR